MNEKTTPRGIIILGPAGAGKTTLGKLTAEKLQIAFLDIDEYIWRKDTALPYSTLYPKEEKIKRLMDAAKAAENFVMAGSMNSFHEAFDPLFLLAVYLTADEQTRAERLHRRELEEFGSRILPGGDMYEMHQSFLKDAADYERGAASCSSEKYALWLSQLACPILRLDGGQPAEKNAETVAAACAAFFEAFPVSGSLPG